MYICFSTSVVNFDTTFFLLCNYITVLFSILFQITMEDGEDFSLYGKDIVTEADLSKSAHVKCKMTRENVLYLFKNVFILIILFNLEFDIQPNHI